LFFNSFPDDSAFIEYIYIVPQIRLIAIAHYRTDRHKSRKHYLTDGRKLEMMESRRKGFS